MPTKYEIQYRVKGDPSTTQSIFDVEGNTHTISDALPSTEYQWRVRTMPGTKKVNFPWSPWYDVTTAPGEGNGGEFTIFWAQKEFHCPSGYIIDTSTGDITRQDIPGAFLNHQFDPEWMIYEPGTDRPHWDLMNNNGFGGQYARIRALEDMACFVQQDPCTGELKNGILDYWVTCSDIGERIEVHHPFADYANMKPGVGTIDFLFQFKRDSQTIIFDPHLTELNENENRQFIDQNTGMADTLFSGYFPFDNLEGGTKGRFWDACAVQIMDITDDGRRCLILLTGDTFGMSYGARPVRTIMGMIELIIEAPTFNNVSMTWRILRTLSGNMPEKVHHPKYGEIDDIWGYSNTGEYPMPEHLIPDIIKDNSSIDPAVNQVENRYFFSFYDGYDVKDVTYYRMQASSDGDFEYEGNVSNLSFSLSFLDYGGMHYLWDAFWCFNGNDSADYVGTIMDKDQMMAAMPGDELCWDIPFTWGWAWDDTMVFYPGDYWLEAHIQFHGRARAVAIYSFIGPWWDDDSWDAIGSGAPQIAIISPVLTPRGILGESRVVDAGDSMYAGNDDAGEDFPDARQYSGYMHYTFLPDKGAYNPISGDVIIGAQNSVGFAQARPEADPQIIYAFDNPNLVFDVRSMMAQEYYPDWLNNSTSMLHEKIALTQGSTCIITPKDKALWVSIPEISSYWNRVPGEWLTVNINKHHGNGVWAAAIRADGTMWEWGNPDQVWWPPQQVGSADNWMQVKIVGSSNFMALKEDGTLWVWGAWDHSTFRLSNFVPAPPGGDEWVAEPVNIPLPAPAIQITGNHFDPRVMLNDGSVYGWPNGNWHPFGVMSTEFSENPQYLFTGSPRSTLRNTAGCSKQACLPGTAKFPDYNPCTVTWATMLVVDNNRDMWMAGPVGGNNGEEPTFEPVATNMKWFGFRNEYETIELLKPIDQHGRLYDLGIVWDGNWNPITYATPHLVFNETGPLNTPVIINKVAVEQWCGYRDFILTGDGRLLAKGQNEFNDLGVESSVNYFASYQEISNEAGVKWCDVQTWCSITVALDENGAAWGWGQDDWDGVLGRGSVVHNKPMELPLNEYHLETCSNKEMDPSMRTRIYLDQNTSAVLDSDDRLWVSGISSSRWQLAQPESTWIMITSGMYQDVYFALRSDGTVWAFGKWQFGLTRFLDPSTPVDAWGNVWPPVQLDGGENFKFIQYVYVDNLFGIKNDGSLWGMGYHNSSGFNELLKPVGSPSGDYRQFELIDSGDWAWVGGNYWSYAALDTNGTLFIWGYVWFYGQEGSPPDEMLQVYTGYDVEDFKKYPKISYGSFTTVVIRPDGALEFRGEIGNTTAYNSPFIQIGTDTDWKAITQYEWNQWLLIKESDCSLWAMGNNWDHQLGSGDSDDTFDEPVQVGSVIHSIPGGAWQDVELTYYGGACGIRGNGTPWMWGSATYWDQYYNVPRQVSEKTDCEYIQSSEGGCLIVDSNKDIWAAGQSVMGSANNIRDRFKVGRSDFIKSAIKIEFEDIRFNARNCNNYLVKIDIAGYQFSGRFANYTSRDEYVFPLKRGIKSAVMRMKNTGEILEISEFSDDKRLDVRGVGIGVADGVRLMGTRERNDSPSSSHNRTRSFNCQMTLPSAIIHTDRSRQLRSTSSSNTSFITSTYSTTGSPRTASAFQLFSNWIEAFNNVGTRLYLRIININSNSSLAHIQRLHFHTDDNLYGVALRSSFSSPSMVIFRLATNGLSSGFLRISSIEGKNTITVQNSQVNGLVSDSTGVYFSVHKDVDTAFILKNDITLSSNTWTKELESVGRTLESGPIVAWNNSICMLAKTQEDHYFVQLDQDGDLEKSLLFKFYNEGIMVQPEIVDMIVDGDYLVVSFNIDGSSGVFRIDLNTINIGNIGDTSFGVVIENLPMEITDAILALNTIAFSVSTSSLAGDSFETTILPKALPADDDGICFD